MLGPDGGYNFIGALVACCMARQGNGGMYARRDLERNGHSLTHWLECRYEMNDIRNLPRISHS